MTMVSAQFKELLLQSLEHEKGGVLVYKTALECVQNRELKKEWEKYLAETKTHVETLTAVCEQFGIDAGETTPGCKVVEHTGKSLVVAMKMALASGDAGAAEIVACECVVIAETKDHADWELLGAMADSMSGEAADALMEAYERIEDEEDEHLYHSKGWCRELWRKSLGLKAVLPPPEEREDVKTAIEAAQAKEEIEPAPRKH
jgi:ferritin-like metal-binding protein YciE